METVPCYYIGPKHSPPSGRKSNYTTSIFAAFSIKFSQNNSTLCTCKTIFIKVYGFQGTIKVGSASNIRLKAFSESHKQ